MPPSYYSIPAGLWRPSFRGLSLEAKVVALYILSAPTRTTEGLFRCATSYMAADTGLSEEAVLTALEELEKAGYVEYDHDQAVLLDCHALRYFPLKNGRNKDGEVVPDKRLTGAVNQVAGVTDSPLFSRFVQLAETYSPDLAKALWEKYGPFIKPLDEPLTEPLHEPHSKPRVEKSRDEQRGEEQSRGEETQSLQSEDGLARGPVARFQKRALARGLGSEEVGA